MILVTTATEFEMNSVKGQSDFPLSSCLTLVTGVGLAQTAQNLTRFLCETDKVIEGVLNVGVSGAYFLQGSSVAQPGLLDICVAERELFGDLGVCMGDDVEYLPSELVGPIEFDLKNRLYDRCCTVLKDAEIEHHCGTFISVNSVTGKRVRGENLQRRWNGLCENMEGAAVAQVCSLFSLPLFELRCISNMVEDRNPGGWRLQEACEKMSITTSKILEELI
jgi:futalosine hydrolase